MRGREKDQSRGLSRQFSKVQPCCWHTGQPSCQRQPVTPHDLWRVIMVMEVTSYPSRCLPHACVCVHVCSWLISYAVWILQRLSLLFFSIERKMRHVTTSYLTILSDTHTAQARPCTASTLLSCPDFSAFLWSWIVFFSPSANGGQKAEKINHGFQSLDHGLKLVHSYNVFYAPANRRCQAWSP